MIQNLWDWAHSKNWITWFWHGVQGLVITALAMLFGLGFEGGVYAVVVHFLLREAPGIYFAAMAKDTLRLVDGVIDFIAPIVGIWLALVLFG